MKIFAWRYFVKACVGLIHDHINPGIHIIVWNIVSYKTNTATCIRGRTVKWTIQHSMMECIYFLLRMNSFHKKYFLSYQQALEIEEECVHS